MSAVMQPQIDPTAGLSLVSRRNADLAKTRYLFFAGNLIDPDRQLQTEHLRDSAGGEEIQTHCLRRSVGGFLERGRLTPMEVWTEAMPSVYIGEGLEQETVRIESAATAAHAGVNDRRPGALAGVGASLVHVKFYPGDEILSVMRANEGKGIVEVKALLDEPWYEADGEGTEDPRRPGLPQRLNRDFFPGRIPETLSGLEGLIEDGAGRSDLHAAVARDMRLSCGQFRRWAELRLSVEHTLLRQRTSPNGQMTYTYSPVARLLLKQLEMKPQDSLLESTGLSAEQVAEIAARFGGGQNSMTPELIAQIVGQVTATILAAQGQQAKGGGNASFEHDPLPPPAKEKKAKEG